jgi:hypothetical protein
MKAAVHRVQEKILQPLSLEEGKQLVHLLDKLVAGHIANEDP